MEPSTSIEPSRPTDSLQVVERRPSEQEVAHHLCPDVRKPPQYLRKVAFQECRQPVADPRLVANESSPMFDE